MEREILENLYTAVNRYLSEVSKKERMERIRYQEQWLIPDLEKLRDKLKMVGYEVKEKKKSRIYTLIHGVENTHIEDVYSHINRAVGVYDTEKNQDELYTLMCKIQDSINEIL